MDVLKFGYKYYKRHMPFALLTLLMGFAFIAIGLLFPQLTQIIIDYVLVPLDPAAMQQGNFASVEGNVFAFLVDGSRGSFGEPATLELLLNLVMLFFILLIVKHVLAYTRNNLVFVYGFKFDMKLRQLTFDKLLTQNSQVLSRYNSGDMLNILNSDITNFRNLFTQRIPYALDALFHVILAAVFLININPYLAILPFAVMPFQLFIFIRYIRRAHRINSDIRNASADLSLSVQENINGVRIVRSFAAEDYEKDKFQKKSGAFRDKYFNQVNFSSKYNLAFNSIRHILYLGCIAVGSVLAIQGHIGIGAFTAFIAYVFNILDSTTHLVNLTFEMQYLVICGERISTFVNTGNIMQEPKDPKKINGQPSIRLDNVTLTFDDHVILKDIDLDIPFGKKVGIMGSTGSGKTSLLKLMIRFNDPYSGNIYLNGINLKDIDMESIREQFGFVFQEVFLFSDTIEANIAFYRPDAPHEDIERCAGLAVAHSFIEKTSKGYSTIVGERGIGLSGGQKQRISIARALLKNAPVLILDDVTSALDSETETEILKNLYAQYAGRTMVISAHRASSVQGCDEIIVLEEGAIIERGSFSQLMELKGIYYDIYTQQHSRQADAVGD